SRRQGQVPAWLFAVFCGRAKWLVLHPPDHDWGKRMLAKRAGYARQRAARLQGEVATEQAMRARRIKHRIKQRWEGSNQSAAPTVAPGLRLSPSGLTAGASVAVAHGEARTGPRGAESVSCRHDDSPVARLTDALKSGRPVGRDARLAFLRHRR